jgi:site-specific DNA recombinase
VRAYTYARYSTDKQTEASIADQQRRCHEYAARHGLQIAADFVDEGISGGALGNRPGVQQALAALKPGDVLLVVDLTRISRSQELAPLLDRLRFRGARVVGVLDGFDSNAPQARMQAGLSGLMSDEFRASIRARTHSALEMRAKMKAATGGRAYGYDATGQVIEHEANIVREIFSRFADGDSMKAIASDLNVRGVPSPGAGWKRVERRADGRWLVSALHAMLHNERYTGRLVWNRSVWVKDPDSGRRSRRERPEAEWIVSDCPRIVAPGTWQAAAARLRARATGERKGHGLRRFLLSGILVCEACGSKLIATGSESHGGRRYVCGLHHGGGDAACHVSASARVDVCEQILVNPIREKVLSARAVDFAVEEYRKLYRAERAREVCGVSTEVAELGAEIADLEALIAARPARADTLRRAVEELRERQAKAQRAAWRRAQGAAAPNEWPLESDYRAAVARMAEVLRGQNIEAAQAVVRGFLGEVPCFQRDEYLVARAAFSTVPLVKAAGLSLHGSGGRI